MISDTKYFWSLIERVQSGNKNSFLELANIFKDKIYLHALRLTGNCILAEKLTTKLFTKAWQHIKYLTPDSPFEIWLNGLTVSIIFSYYRGKKESNEPFVDARPGEKGPTVICADKVDEVYLNLSTEQRLILYLHDYEGYTPEDCTIIFNEKHISKLKDDLHSARLKSTDNHTIELLNTFGDREWGNFIQDFEHWQIDDHSVENMTDTLKMLSNYRKILSNLLTANQSPINLLDGLTKILFEENEQDHQKNKQDSQPNKRMDPALIAQLKKEGIDVDKDSLM